MFRKVTKFQADQQENNTNIRES